MAERYVSLFSGKRTDYDLIDVRNQTFRFYPSSDISTVFYAEAGFYYTGDNDTCRCFRCGFKINKLRHGEDPFQVHRYRSPHCRFVLERIANEERHLDESEIDSDSDELNFEIDSDSDCDETATLTTISTSGKIGNSN